MIFPAWPVVAGRTIHGPGSPMPASVSVVIPAYGHAEYVVQAVESVLAQTLPPLEVIVVDDGSPDDTGARLAPLAAAGRIRYVRQANAGVAAARNHGASLARGEFLCFVDDDDLLFPHALATLAAPALRPELALVYGQRAVFRDGTSPSAPASVPVGAAPCDWARFLMGNRIATPGQVLLRREAFMAVGGFDPEIWGADDWDLWLRLLRRFAGVELSATVMAYRLHEQNNSWHTARMWEHVCRVLHRHLPSAPLHARAALARHALAWYRGYLSRQARGQLRRAAQDGQWLRAGAAARILARMWLAEQWSRVTLKAALLRRGDWRSPTEQTLRHVVQEP